MEAASPRAQQDAEATRLFTRTDATEKAAVSILTTADPLLVSDTVLNGLVNNLQSWCSQVSAYASNGTVGHLQNAMPNVDGVLALLGQIRAFAASRARGSLEAVRTYGRTVQN